MSAPTVSVLIPCRNAGRYLGATLESALNQTLSPLEVIVVDDGSTDDSQEIAGQHTPSVTLVTSSGRGASAARSHGSRLARGEFFQYLDADDLLEPHALSSRVEALERTGRGVAISDWQRVIDKEGRWVPDRIESGRPADPDMPADLSVFRGFWAPPAAVLYRRSVWQCIGEWRETLPVIQDARFLLDAARVAGGFVHVPGVGARYRQHRSGSLSTDSNARFWWDVLRNAREVETVWQETGSLDEPRREALAEAYAGCARVGFVIDRTLFDASRAELERFGTYPLPKFVRASVWLNRLAGYRAARTALAPFCREARV